MMKCVVGLHFWSIHMPAKTELSPRAVIARQQELFSKTLHIVTLTNAQNRKQDIKEN